MRFIIETLDNKSDKRGPRDANGWPTHHPDFVIHAASKAEADKIAEERYPDNVMVVYQDGD